MLEYKVSAKRVDAHGSLARCKDAEIVLDTDVGGRPDAFNPAELLWRRCRRGSRDERDAEEVIRASR